MRWFSVRWHLPHPSTLSLPLYFCCHIHRTLHSCRLLHPFRSVLPLLPRLPQEKLPLHHLRILLYKLRQPQIPLRFHLPLLYSQELLPVQKKRRKRRMKRTTVQENYRKEHCRIPCCLRRKKNRRKKNHPHNRQSVPDMGSYPVLPSADPQYLHFLHLSRQMHSVHHIADSIRVLQA